MRQLRAMVEQLPRIRARDELARLPARRIGSVPPGKGQANSLLAMLRGDAEGRAQQPRATGLEAFAIIRAANDKARAEGLLWEQRKAREAVGV